MLENMRKEACVTKLSEFHSGSVLLDSYFMHYSFILILKWNFFIAGFEDIALTCVSLCVWHFMQMLWKLIFLF